MDAIFQATVRILPQFGSQNLTTKKIAEVAGISIGSLYQYFPNKESVLAAVMDASADLINSTFNSRFSKLADKNLDEAIQYTVDTAMEVFLAHRTTTSEVFKQASELGRMPAIMGFRRVTVTQLSAELNRRYPEISLRECERICFVTVNSLMGVVFTMLYDETQTWTREELALELGFMMRAYVHKKINEANSKTPAES